MKYFIFINQFSYQWMNYVFFLLKHWGRIYKKRKISFRGLLHRALIQINTKSKRIKESKLQTKRGQSIKRRRTEAALEQRTE